MSIYDYQHTIYDGVHDSGVHRADEFMKSDDSGPAPRRKRSAGTQGKRRVTMTDVARLAMCSQATVSFVLNRTPGVTISDATRARVIDAARELNYGTASLAHHEPESAPVSGQGSAPDRSSPAQPAGFAKTQERIIGFVVDRLATSPEAVVAIDGVRQAAKDEGWMVLVAQTMNDAEMEHRTVRTLIGAGATALVYMTIFTRAVVLPDWLRNAPVPVVLLNCYGPASSLPSVVPAEIAGGARATQHLVDHGHRRIATITGEPWMEAAQDRLKGYTQALDRAGLTVDPDLVIEGDWSASAGFDATRRLLSLTRRPTAIFCQNDRMAIGCYEAIKEAGLVIPGDISVVGYDDEEISRHLNPQLTTLVLPQRAMGAWAVQHIDGKSAAKTRRRFPVKLDCALVSRLSVAPPPAHPAETP